MANAVPFVRSFSFVDGQQRVTGGSAVVAAPSTAEPSCTFTDGDGDDADWSDAQTAAFMAGGPLTLSWVTQSPEQPGSERVYVCCWITIDADHTPC